MGKRECEVEVAGMKENKANAVGAGAGAWLSLARFEFALAILLFPWVNFRVGWWEAG